MRYDGGHHGWVSWHGASYGHLSWVRVRISGYCSMWRACYRTSADALEPLWRHCFWEASVFCLVPWWTPNLLGLPSHPLPGGTIAGNGMGKGSISHSCQTRRIIRIWLWGLAVLLFWVTVRRCELCPSQKAVLAMCTSLYLCMDIWFCSWISSLLLAFMRMEVVWKKHPWYLAFL